MGAKPSSFKKKLLATSISSCLLASAGVMAQEVIEDVVVLGVRGAQENAINIKRDATSIVDSISAEDIGKLPDVTIADSLQRISGVQIRRSAGEGANINIRGLPQVVTQLNGEVYLGAGSVTTVQPNFSDIPSQLFKGADVIKSPTASLSSAGLTGTVDLKTRRPFEMDHGFTYAGGLELQTGEDSKETDPNLNGLINWKGDKVGALFAASYSNANLANYYNGLNSEIGWSSTISEEADGTDYNNDGDLADKFVGYQGFSAWNQFTERERYGLNGSLQVDLGEGFEFTADWFYTSQDEYNRKAGLSFTDKWASQNFFTVESYRDTGVDGYNTAQEYEVTARRLKSFSQNDAYFSRSNNLNLELNYDNGGAFTATTRFVRGKADQEYRHGFFEGDLTDGTTTNIWRDEIADRIADGAKHSFFPSSDAGEPGYFAPPNPRGYSEDPTLTVDYSGSDPVWGGFDNTVDGRLGTGADALTIAEYLGDPRNYNQAAITSENNYDRRGDLQVFRFDGSLELADAPFVTSVDFGTRLSQRSASSEVFHLLTRFHEGTELGVDADGVPNPDGCLARWKATDITFAEDCQVGEFVDGEFFGYTAIGHIPLDSYGNSVISVTDYGPVSGIPTVYTLDPKVFDDTVGFQRSVYNNVERSVDPGLSYNVDLDEFSYFVQANFEHGIVSGNFGVRIVETDLTVKQNTVGQDRSYGLAALDLGDSLTKRDYSDVLPALNVAVEPTEDLKFRFAYAETMTPLDLNQWGDAISISYALNDEGIQAVNSATQNGNPLLNPWRSKNYDLSAEWYFAPGSMASIGLFYVDVDSFVSRSVVEVNLPDLDGVVRRTTNMSTNVQGEGGTLEGMELTYRQSFDFLDGIWGNFGIDSNVTFSPSEQSSVDVEGNKRPFQDNSELQYNLVGWYQGDRFQARLALNHRSERLDATDVAGGLDLYQEATTYLDANASYDINDQVTAYVNASNITGEYEKYYFQWEDQYAFSRVFEPRLTVGVRARF